MQSQCYGPQCSDISSYQWILYEQYPSATNNDTVWRKIQDLQLITTTSLDSSSIVIKEDSLNGGKNYRLALFVQTMDGQQGMSAHDISTASLPTGGTCSITPSNGTSLKTVFNLSCSDWESDSTPLSYLFQYQLQNGLHGLLYNGSSSSVNSWLPSGKLSWNYAVKVNVTVTDKNGVSAPRVHLPVQVEPFPELLRPDQISRRITANDSEFNNAIKDGDLNKAERLANAILQAILEDATMDSTKKSKVIN
ncbi:polycystic kidney disease 1-related protein-like [Orbicella faveolata]|uniref:polycystic kidney disease 1-related protein-like n=1 Tax=Orbicella faveolata TaxID=48498 RepID=UPI0009E1A9FF|nr:polycystic kidney disease 1-related protein-like [Orbicella faveolata]